MINKDIEKEQEYLRQTIDIIKKMIEDGDLSIEEASNSISEIKKYIWENIGNVDDIEVETNMYDVNKKVDYANENILKMQKLRKALSTPYFGRLDFTPKKSEKKMSIYVGLTGVKEDMNFYVFDWRTPIASLFYNYGIGEAKYNAPRGEIEGNISLRRQYKIIDGKIERCFDSSLNIDDGYLQEILSNSSSEKMTNIVNTIQKDQNQIIRNVTDKHLIVQGIAGSGKTSVALHRIAYLMYQKKELNSNNILIFSPNNVFSEYISQVLPDLGEENVLQTTFSDFSQRFIKRFRKIESFTEFVERYYKTNNFSSDELKMIKYKNSNEFIKLLDKNIDKYKKGLYFSDDFSLMGKEIPCNVLNKLFKEKYIRLPIPDRIDMLVEYICDSLKLSYSKYKRTVRKQLRELLKNTTDIKELYKDIVNTKEFKDESKISTSSEFKYRGKLNYEDLIPLMYLQFEINGYPKDIKMKHVVIDEAQDYTLVQLRMLKKIFPSASFTILGDINQNINPYYSYENLNEINSIFENEGKFIELNKTYRSSQEIIEYTNKIIDIDNACSIRKSNSIMVEHKDVKKEDITKNIIFDIDRMKSEGMKKIAIITKNNAQAVLLYSELSDLIHNLSIISDSKSPKIGSTVILPSYISKGLEFDGVIVYTDSDNYYKEKDKHLYYVVCTRAQHALNIYNQDSLMKNKIKIK